MATRTRTPLLVLLAILSGCSIVTLSEQGRSQRYFGFVKVQVPAVDGNVSAIQTKAVGMSLRDGVHVGWESSEQVYVPLRVLEGTNQPFEATCSVVVIVRDTHEATSVREMLSTISGENICMAQFDASE